MNNCFSTYSPSRSKDKSSYQIFGVLLNQIAVLFGKNKIQLLKKGKEKKIHSLPIP